MPRRRSDGLTLGVAAATVGVAAFAIAGCQVGTGDTGCSITRQIVIPGTTPLPLFTQVRIDRLGSGYVLIGADDTSVRWAMMDAVGHVGAEQTLALPAGTLHAFYGLAGATVPGDTVVVGL